MKKTLNLLFTLSIISPQLWSADPAAPPAKAAAAAAAPPGFETKKKMEAEHEGLLPIIRALIADPANKLKLDVWNIQDPHTIEYATNCGMTAHRIVNLLTGIENSVYHTDKASLTSVSKLLAQDKAGKFIDEITHDLFDRTQEEHSIFFVMIHGIHTFFLEKYNKANNFYYRTYQSWINSFTPDQWLHENDEIWKAHHHLYPRMKEPFEKYTLLREKYGKGKKLDQANTHNFVRDIFDILGNVDYSVHIMKLSYPFKPTSYRPTFCLLESVNLFLACTAQQPIPRMRRSSISEHTICCICAKPAIKKCPHCDYVSYCSVACQDADWPGHQPTCAE